jgi:hypothetical protein
MDNGGNIILLFDEKKRKEKKRKEKKRKEQIKLLEALDFYTTWAWQVGVPFYFPPIYMIMIMSVQTDI